MPRNRDEEQIFGEFVLSDQSADWHIGTTNIGTTNLELNHAFPGAGTIYNTYTFMVGESRVMLRDEEVAAGLPQRLSLVVNGDVDRVEVTVNGHCTTCFPGIYF